MGNCQAIDAAALVLQHPSGKIERMYWSIQASEVMKMNPGHYVSLIIPISSNGEEENNNNKGEVAKNVKFTRVKLLKPSDTLVLGRAYRLVTSQEVTRVLREKRNAKLKKKQQESNEKSKIKSEEEAESEKPNQITTHEGNRQNPISTNYISMRPKSWRPSLRTISEGEFNGDYKCKMIN